VDVPIVGDARDVLTELIKQVMQTEHTEWLEKLNQYRREHPFQDTQETEQLLPQYVINQLYEVTRGESIIVTGVGQHQMWAAQHYWFNKPNCLITSGGLGTMGFGLPASIGVKIGRPDEDVWCIDGDGSFQMTMHELATITQENLAIKIAILNNGYLGMVRQWQDLFYNKHYVATPLTCPDFIKIADAYGIPALRVTQRNGVTAAIRQAMDTPGPFLTEFAIEPEENVYPMVPPGAQLFEVLEVPKKEVGAWPRRITP
jgi:acetolactate synthase-1/2/3 large subunit